METTVAAAGGAAALNTTVQVTIDEVPDIETTTDSDGNFVLSGDFSGMITLRFVAPGMTATQPIDVPAGSTTVIEDVMLAPQRVEANAIRVLGFYGQVALVDCTAGEILVNDRHPTANQFMIRLSSDTVLIRGNGQALQCSDIHVNDLIAVEGVVRQSDRTVGAVTLTISPGQPGQPGPKQPLRFVGDVLVINCSSGMLLIDDATIGQSRLRISNTTRIVDASQRPVSCTQIVAGAHVSGQGTILVRQPGVIDVLSMTVTAPTS
ncbi:MAG TPA: hypothetical protein VMW17_18730 [Candidatus Binatia bacterium]|nr:hypothetical protein [Candidatus Binatia bacterium]